MKKKLIVNDGLVTTENAEVLVDICPFNAIEFDGDKLTVNAACKMCGICVNKGPRGVMEFLELETKRIDKSQWVGMSVFVEQDHGKIHPVGLELIGKAHELAAVVGHPVYAVLIGSNLASQAAELLEYGCTGVYLYDDPRLENFNPELYAACLIDFVEKQKPSVILYGGTALGRSLAPRVASHFRTGLTADCTILDMKKNTDLIQNRPAFGGNVMASIVCPNNRPQMATVRYKIFALPDKVTPHGTVHRMPLDFELKTNMRHVESRAKPKDIDIAESEVLVAIGRGFNSPEAIAMAKELAGLLGGQLAVTRPLVEAGVARAQDQIGLSGRTVAPKLLFSIGISGAVQYTAGMRGADLTFAINTDKTAPIFDAVHYGIVGDAYEIVPQLIAELKKLKGLV